MIIITVMVAVIMVMVMVALVMVLMVVFVTRLLYWKMNLLAVAWGTLYRTETCL